MSAGAAGERQRHAGGRCSCEQLRRAEDLDRRHAARGAKAAGTRSGKEAEKFMSAGKLVPDEVVIGLVDERLELRRRQKRLHSRRFSAHGPPGRGARRSCSRTRERPSITSSKSTFRGTFWSSGPPCAASTNGLDKSTTSSIIRRPRMPSSNTEPTTRRRPSRSASTQYDAMTAALLPHYEKQGLLRRVDGVGKPEEVTDRIIAELRE